MSLNNMDLHVDTRYLRDRSCELMDEKKIALRLYEHIAAIRRLSDNPDISGQCYSILNDVDSLVTFLQKMSDAMSYIEEKTVQVSKNVGGILEESSDRAEIAVSNAFSDVML